MSGTGSSIVGIRAFGTYVPEGRMSAAEIAAATEIPEDVIAQKFGVIEKPIPGPQDTPAFMGMQAAKQAIANSGVRPEDIDLVIWNGAQHKDYPCWLASLKIAHDLGATRAWGFDMEAMCGSMMAAMEMAQAMMLQNQHYLRVLLVSGYRNADLIDLAEPGTRFMLDLGASGAALLLERDWRENVILGSAFKGDGSFSEDCVVPVLGARAWPPSAEDLGHAHFAMQDADSFKKKLGERTLPNFYEVIRTSLARAGRSTVDYLAILHFKKSAHDQVVQELGLGENQTTYLDHFGHLGQNDQVMSIELGLRDGKISAGDTVVMVGAGLGFVWASTVVHWGPLP